MSLGATLAADGMRPASFLPTIKCSSCGNEIEISAMGDHICGKAPPSPKSTPATMANPFTLRALNAMNSKPAQPSPLQNSASPPPPQTRVRAPTIGSSQIPLPKSGRPPLPRINADAANQPFLAPLPMPEAPISPASSVRSGSSNGSRRPPPLRSMTSPMPRLFDPRPPSPELSANLDCAFPPFPMMPVANSGSRPSTSSGRKTPTGSERSSSRSGSRQGGPRFVADPYSMDTRSPVSKAGETVINRMNALQSGPFDPTPRRPSNDDRTQAEPRPLDRRRPSENEEQPAGGVLLAPFGSEERSTEASTPSGPHEFSQQTSQEKTEDMKKPPPRPTRPNEGLSPMFLNDMNTDASSTSLSVDEMSQFPAPPRSPERSQTFPQPAATDNDGSQLPTLSRMASEPSLRTRLPQPNQARPDQQPSNFQPAHPPRGQSRNVGRIDYRMQDAPPVPKPVDLHRSDSFHKSSASNSSTGSSAHSLGTSGGPSPVTSAASSVDAFSPLADDAGQYGDQALRVQGLNIKSRQAPGMRAEQPKTGSPPRNVAKPSILKEAVAPVEEQQTSLPEANRWPLESPMDPAMQNGKLGDVSDESPPPPQFNMKTETSEERLAPRSLKRSSSNYDPYRAVSPQRPPPERAHSRGRSKTNTGPRPQPLNTRSPSRSRTPQPMKPSFLSQDPMGPQMRPPPPQASNPPPSQDGSLPPLQRRGTVAGAKPKCRGCGQQIEGKSVKAADGRLTGRWHKACFVCKTCEEPFTSADFYVINNHPYCEQHYHEKNGSLCNGCHRGIEGQYLETSSAGPAGRVSRKYHRRCFVCVDCRAVLSDDYFEIAGRIHCERHALAAMRASPARPMGGPGRPGLHPHGASGLRAERRSTKLMQM